jgi:branched-chain amino acid transport system permease protein
MKSLKGSINQTVIWIGILILLAALPIYVPRYVVWLATEALIFGLFANGLNLLLGYGGLISFGHAAYFGIGGYACTLLLKKAGLSMGLGIAFAPLITALGALIIGWFCVRLASLYFAMLTMAFAQLIWAIVFKLHFFGAQDGIVGIPVPSNFVSPVNYYYLVLGIVTACYLIFLIIVNSPFGQMLKAARENEERARFIGLNVRRHRLIAFVISGAFSGLAGALFVLMNRTCFPEMVYWNYSGEVIVICLLGGTSLPIGPTVGAWVVVFLRKFITDFTFHWPLILGIILGLVVLCIPGGITGFVRDRIKTAIEVLRR